MEREVNAGAISVVMIPGVVATKIVDFRYTTAKSRSIHTRIKRLNDYVCEINRYS